MPDVERHGQADFLHGPEKVAHVRVEKRHVANHFADALAASCLVLLQDCFQWRLRVIADGARVDVAERNETAWILLCGLQDVLVCLRQLELRADQRQENCFFYVGAVIKFDELGGGRPGFGAGNLQKGSTIRMRMDVDEHVSS